MKTVIYVMISMFCVLGNGQNTQHAKENKTAKVVIPIDTVSILQLRKKRYIHRDYKVLRLCNLDSNGYWIDTTRRIELTQKNKTTASIRLPIPNYEVKNFSVVKIAETRGGFKIVISWGEGIILSQRILFYVQRQSSLFQSFKNR